MKISGSGRIEGGKLEEELIVSGSGHILDDLECKGIRASGSLHGKSALITHGDVQSSGSFQIGGFLQGDNDAKFSGSASIGQEVALKGILKSSGSFRAGGDVSAISGISTSGSANITGNISSEKEVSFEGSARISGNIAGEDVLVGTKYLKLGKRIFAKKKYPYRIYGSIKARNNVEIFRARVVGNITGRNVKIDKGSYVKGDVYYVDTIEIHPKAKVLTQPVQIKEEDLERFTNSVRSD